MTVTPLRCCVCGRGTEGAADYVQMDLRTAYSEGFQTLGAHASCLNGVMGVGFVVEVHLFGRGDGDYR